MLVEETFRIAPISGGVEEVDMSERSEEATMMGLEREKERREKYVKMREKSEKERREKHVKTREESEKERSREKEEEDGKEESGEARAPRSSVGVTSAPRLRAGVTEEHSHREGWREREEMDREEVREKEGGGTSGITEGEAAEKISGGETGGEREDAIFTKSRKPRMTADKEVASATSIPCWHACGRGKGPLARRKQLRQGR